MISTVERFGGTSQIRAEVNNLFEASGQTSTFCGSVRGICQVVYGLLNEASEQRRCEIVEACFECWAKMSKFGGNGYSLTYLHRFVEIY